MKYNLMMANGEDEVYHGAYLIVDGGYHKVRCARFQH